MPSQIFAAIDVGSFELTMKIFEFTGKKKMRELDCLVTRLALGSDTYRTGKIGNDKVEELCRVLLGFREVMRSYGAEEYRAYGTSAIRETENSEILLDKIEQRTGIRIGILSNSEQRFLDYKSLASIPDIFQEMTSEGAIILDIGGGSIQLSLFENDTLVSTQNLLLGVLRIQEKLNVLGAEMAQMESIVDELVSAQLSTYKKIYVKGGIPNLIIVDDYISPWAVRRATGGGGRAMVDRRQFEELRGLLRDKSAYKLSRELDIAEEKIPLLMISAMLTARVAEVTGAERVWAPGVSLCDGIAYEYAQEKKLLANVHDFERDIIACAKNISKRYLGSRTRGETLAAITSTIFESMKKIHGLGKREALYLEIATILHGCGKYISLMNIGDRSYEIIMATEIIGLSHTEREIVANIVRFNHSDFIYYGQPGSESSSLDRDSYLIVAKLTAILRLANSLDRSHKKKMVTVRASLREADNELVLTSDTPENILLEQVFFADAADFFEEVYSIRPVLRQKKRV